MTTYSNIFNKTHNLKIIINAMKISDFHIKAKVLL